MNKRNRKQLDEKTENPATGLKLLKPEVGFDTLKTALTEWEHKTHEPVASAKRSAAKGSRVAKPATLAGILLATSATVFWLGKRILQARTQTKNKS